MRGQVETKPPLDQESLSCNWRIFLLLGRGCYTVTETDEPASRPSMRADARRNRERILVAARDVFVETGTDAPLEEIATRAGVGIATLYRRFPERVDLMRAVVLDVLHQTMVEI